MSYGQELRNGKVKFAPYTLVAGSTGEIDLEGATLCSLLLLADITSTSFTIQVSNQSGGTFATLKDPLASGADITYTLNATATGCYAISPLTTAGFRYCKLIFSSSETPTIYIGKRSMD